MADVKPLEPGLKYCRSITVEKSLTVPHLSPVYTGLADMPEVLATPHMVAFVEWTCVEALRPCYGPGQGSVGTHINMSHVAATPVGKTVTAEVEIVSVVKGRLIEFKVTCTDDNGLIGEGTHTRAIIDVDKFLAKMGLK